MTQSLIKTAILAAAIGIAATSAARADCESDLKQLEHAFTTPNLAAPAKAALDAAKTKAVAALKKDDDKTCHAAVAEGLSKAGLKMK
ncbi:MAG: hypothetical protein BGP05_04880 [Rhizobiales bacterium 62-47]|jgi:hypothetical protein|uniref:hypothetical protein n=1 Tax=Afipia sp. 1NLS2 TaxID=666684 RepID=UPI0001D9E092|nr:hypothetical protein [Afipia sp. 1NLS2]EFI52870.1 conserved hypothetical protein [Afipia sp. 1NLS2]MBN9043121.1 hypothetical protein [Hyphomicrobiales bacterium]MCO5131505.1 hypothetical protein [Xanthobacteraceae bacterium]OJY09079.1 MAG: hypothetical protein BGP05_04880 [Rhizobiales bacterium 62-47]